jgi:hypothetical protein
MNRTSQSLLIVLAACACTSQPGYETIRRAEEKLVLPKGAEQLSSYNRFYAISGDSARGIFIWSPSEKGKLTVVATEKDLPFVADGGCDVIQVQLNLESEVWKHAFCHGP